MIPDVTAASQVSNCYAYWMRHYTNVGERILSRCKYQSHNEAVANERGSKRRQKRKSPRGRTSPRRAGCRTDDENDTDIERSAVSSKSHRYQGTHEIIPETSGTPQVRMQDVTGGTDTKHEPGTSSKRSHSATYGNIGETRARQRFSSTPAGVTRLNSDRPVYALFGPPHDAFPSSVVE